MVADPAYEIQTVDRLLAVLNNGDEGAEATRLYRDLMERLATNVEEHGGKHKGELVIKIGFVADTKGIDVTVDTSAKLPKKPVIKERFFLSEKNTLTAQDPAKETMFPGMDLGRRRAMPAAE